MAVLSAGVDSTVRLGEDGPRIIGIQAHEVSAGSPGSGSSASRDWATTCMQRMGMTASRRRAAAVHAARKLTVLNVAYPLAPVGLDAVGGAEQVLTAVETAAWRAGHRSLVLACDGSRAAGELFAFSLPPGSLTDDRCARVRANYRRAIEDIVAGQDVDLVHFHGLDFHTYVPAAPVPVLATLHLPCSWYPPGVFSARRPCTFLNCVSSAQRRTCPPGTGPLLEVIPNGVDLARFGPGRRGDSALVLGRICPEKGVHLALEAAHRAGIALLVAGRVFAYPAHQRYFRDEVRPRLDARRCFIGAVGMEDKPSLLASARCLVVPSTAPETSSLVALEALASGVPVVAFPVGALPELIEHGRTGMLVRSVDEMADAMAAASDIQPEVCRAVAERFPLEAMCHEYLQRYQRIAG